MQMCVCGSANIDQANYCSACGKKLDPPLPRCRNCSAELMPGAGFCTGCGVPVDDAAMAAAADPPPPPSVRPRAFDPRMLIGPITTLEGARTMARIGAAGSALLFLIILVRDAQTVALGYVLPLLVYLLVLAIYGGSTFALWRGWTIGGLASLVLHGLALIESVIAYKAYREADPLRESSLTAGRFLFIILVWVIIPAALVCGIRGAMAWNRFRRGEVAPTPTS